MSWSPSPQVESVLRAQEGCLTREQARRLGMSDNRVRDLLRSMHWQSVRNGVLRPTGQGHDVSDLRAALLTQAPRGQWPAGVALTLWTAAACWQFEGVGTGEAVHVAVPRVWMPDHRATGIRLHRCLIPPEHIVMYQGLPITSPAWTALALIRVLSRREAVVVADSALRTGLCTIGDLRAALPRLARLRGCVQARDVVDLAREGVDSPQESRTRMIIIEGHLPHPDVNMRLFDDVGRLLARGELGYRRLLIWLEYDGYDVHSRRPTFRLDRTRQNWLADRGWYILRFVDEDLRRGERRMQYGVRRAIEQAPARVAALPAGLSPEADEARRQLAATDA